MVHRPLVLYCLVGLLLCALSTGLYIQYLMQKPLGVTQPMVIEVHRGSSAKGCAQHLNQLGVLHANDLVWLMRLTGHTRGLHAGEYRIEPGMNLGQLMHRLVSGQVFYRRFSLIAGWNLNQLSMALNRHPYITHTRLDSEQLNLCCQVPKTTPLEGRFFPETYFFRKGTPDKAILQRAYQLMQRRLAHAWAKRQANVSYPTMDDALIVASIIEKETRVDTERPRIARVVLNRLAKGMRLQLDPTVIYALGKRFHGRLTQAQLGIPSAFNTYLHQGLPPTPIAIPSAASIHAALHPESGCWLYFVAQGDGTHRFSCDLPSHQHAVAQYRLRS